MPNEILTALGLDLTQYETGVSRAAQLTQLLGRAIDGVDGGLRKIPVVGGAYAATLGNIVDGFAQATVNAREFSRIMETDVSGSLEGSIVHVEQINDQIKKLADHPIQNRVTSFLGGLFSGKKDDVLGGIKELFTGEKQEKEILALDRRREETLERISDLRIRETQAQSEAYSKNKLATDLARINLTLGEKNLAAEQLAFALGGPDKAKWSDQVNHRLEEQLALNEDIARQETAAAVARNQTFKAELESRTAIAALQASGNQRTIAEEELRAAKQRLSINKASGAATEQQLARDEASVKIAEQALAFAKKEYENQVKQSELHTRVVELEVTGQTRAANQARIREQFEVQITEAKRRGNIELASQLEKQQKLAGLQEAVRQYELGAQGRAAERLAERKRAQTIRIVESQQRSRDGTREQGLHSGGLRAGGLRTGNLNAPLHTQPAKQAEDKFQSFADKLFNILTQ